MLMNSTLTATSGSFHFIWKDPHSWEHLPYDYSHFALSFCYLLILIVSIVMFNIFDYRNGWVFVGTFCGATSSRCVLFAVEALRKENMLHFPRPFFFLIATLPSFFFFSAFVVVLFSWGELFISGESKNKKRKSLTINLKRFLTVLNIFVYIVLLFLYCLDFWDSCVKKGCFAEDKRKDFDLKTGGWADNDFEQAILIFCAALYIFIPLGFLFYVYMRYHKIYHGNIIHRLYMSLESKYTLRKMSIITLFGMVCFLVRAFTVIFSDFDIAIQSYWWIDLLYFSLLETVPLSLLLGTYVKRKNRNKESQLPHSISFSGLSKAASEPNGLSINSGIPRSISSPLLSSSYQSYHSAS